MTEEIRKNFIISKLENIVFFVAVSSSLRNYTTGNNNLLVIPKYESAIFVCTTNFFVNFI